MRTRDEQIAALMGVISPHDEYPHVTELLERHILEAEARGAAEQRRKDAEEIKLRFHTAFSKVKVGDIIAFMHPKNEKVKAFCPYTVVPNNPDKPYELVRFSLHHDGTYLYQQSAKSWKDDGGYIIHSPANVAALEAALLDPAAVHQNMLRETIAKPSWDQIKHLYPMEFAALKAETDELKEAEQLARADAEASKARGETLKAEVADKGLAAVHLLAVLHRPDLTKTQKIEAAKRQLDAQFITGELRAALTREGGV